MKNISCFCASNPSGDSVYSGYLRWRMGLPLPPIPQEEELNICKNTNKEIFNEISGVKNVNDFTIEENDVDSTPKRFRRRKINQNSTNTNDQSFVALSNTMPFRENPIYTKAFVQHINKNTSMDSAINSSVQFCPIKDEIFIPTKSDSLIDNTEIYYSTKSNLEDSSISSFLVNKFLSNVRQCSDSFQQNLTNLGIDNKPQGVVALDSNIEEVLPPAVPPHRKPSTIIEESVSECGSVKGVSVMNILENSSISTLESLCENSDKTITPIPIYSIKHGDIDKIISESLSDYDYAYNKSWTEGVQLSLSINLVEDNKKAQLLFPKNQLIIDEFMEISKESYIDDQDIQSSSLSLDQSNLSLATFTDNSDDSVGANSLPHSSSTPFLKLSSIEADALKQSSTKLSRNSEVSSSFADSETDSRKEPWDVIHGRFVKELTDARFIDLSIINNNKPSMTKATSTESNMDSFKNSYSRNRTITPGLESKRSKDSLRRFHVNINPSLPLEKQPWYHFYLTRSKSESLLANHRNGSFLVRRSESNKNDYSLTIKHKGIFLHMKISKNEKGFVLGEYSQPYQSIPHMLYHYCLTMVPVRGADAACLRFAVTKDRI